MLTSKQWIEVLVLDGWYACVGKCGVVDLVIGGAQQVDEASSVKRAE